MVTSARINITFNHIFIINPSKDLDMHTLASVCNKMNFHLSGIFLFSNRYWDKYKYKKYYVPCFKLKDDISNFIEKLNIKGRLCVVINDLKDLSGFNQYMKNINVISIKTKALDRTYTFDYLSYLGFCCSFNDAKTGESIWQKF